ncbi:MAG TPA: hypothetical protein VK586_15905, partial [Streptosporangiaceae bacterium]|nr:hypothetical protein [Streptosporangiaceae bacterium]
AGSRRPPGAVVSSPGEQSTPQPTAPNPELGHETTHVATEELKTGSLGWRARPRSGWPAGPAPR